MNVRIMRLAGLLGLAAPVVGFTMIFLSIQLSPWFSFTEHALSDLGRSGTGAALFNGGLSLTGLLLMMFNAGFFELTDGSAIGRLGSIIHLVAALSLVGLGPANINVRPWHVVLSVAFFASLTLAMAFFSAWAYLNGMRGQALIGAAASFVSGVVWLFDWPGIAIPESISVVSTTAWQVSLASRMYTWKEREKGFPKNRYTL